MTVERDELVAVPPGIHTGIAPVVAPLGTVAVRNVDDTAVKPAAVPLNVTEVAAFRFWPVISPLVPIAPAVAEKPVIGAAGRP